MNVGKYIDHTLLKATAKPEDIVVLCDEAKTYNFYAVCVNGCYVKLAKEQLANTDVKVASVIGFPLGMMSIESKVMESVNCIKDGADEIDMVINIGQLNAKNFDYIEEEITEIKKAIGDKVLKVIIETCYLTDEEKQKVCEIALKANADFVKTSTGFGTGGATYDDVKLMYNVVKGKAQVKASGGVRDLETALKHIELGATRLGTSSGVKIVTGEGESSKDY